jgi:hypothetical protein
MLDTIIRSMARGFGWGIGRRAAGRVPLWVGVVLIVIWLILR